MSEHTPGPWSWCRPEMYWLEASHSYVVSSEWGDAPLVVSEADARLVAAAPDLLAALEDEARWLKDEAIPTAETSVGETWYRKRLHVIYAAIAKAKGAVPATT